MPTAKDLLELIKKFEETVDEWPKDGGMFANLMGEKIKKLEKDFLQEIATQVPSEYFYQPEATPQAIAGMQEVYIALYQMDGYNLARWALTLGSIAIQGVSRPIYEKEEDVLSLLRTREHREREGYAIVSVPVSAIVHSPTPHRDKFDHNLLHIKAGAIKAENIKKFVHMTGQYLWRSNQLSKLDMASPLSGRH